MHARSLILFLALAASGCSRLTSVASSSSVTPAGLPSITSATLTGSSLLIRGTNLDQVKSLSVSHGGAQATVAVVTKTGGAIDASLSSPLTIFPLLTAIINLQTADAAVNAPLTINLSGTNITNFASTGINDLAATTALTIDADGQVGIGTTLPSQPFNVRGTSAFQLPGATYGDTVNVYSGSGDVQSTWGTALSGSSYIGSVTGHGFALKTTNVSRVYVTPSGFVGIGTTTPQAMLDVQGLMRLRTYLSTPVPCVVANAGSIALTHLYVGCVCNGAAWVALSDGVTACAW